MGQRLAACSRPPHWSRARRRRPRARPSERRCTRGPSTSRSRGRPAPRTCGPRPGSRSSGRSGRRRRPPPGRRPRPSPAACSRSRRRGLHASVRSGSAAPSASAFVADERVLAGQVDVIGMTISVPGPNDGSSPPAALVSTTTVAPSALEEQHRLDDQPRVVALVEVEPALEHDDRRPGQRAEQQAAGVPGRGRGRPARQVRERDRDRRPRGRRRGRRARTRARCRRPGRAACARGRPPRARPAARAASAGSAGRIHGDRRRREVAGRTCGPPGYASRG